MTRLIFILSLILLPIATLGQTYPQATSPYVNDFESIIDAETESRITEDLIRLRNEQGIEMTVVTIDRMSDYGARHGMRVFATGLFNAWGVGNAYLNNGVLFLVAKGDREMFIALGRGYPDSYDDRMDRVFDQHVKHHFQDENYSLGIEKGVLETIKRTDADWTPPAASQIAEWSRNVIAILMVGFVAVGIFYMAVGDVFWAWITSLRRCPNCGQRQLSRWAITENKTTTTDQLGYQEEVINIQCLNCDYTDETRRLKKSGKSSGPFGRYGQSGISGGGGVGGGSFGGGGSSGGGGGGRW